MLLLGSSGVSSLRGLLQVLLTLFSCFLSIQQFYYGLFVSIFYSKIVFFLLLYPVVDLFLHPCHQLVLSLFWIVLFCLYCLNPVPIYFEPPFFHQNLLIHFLQVLSDLSAVIFLGSFHFVGVFFVSSFACGRSFFIRHCSFNSNSRFEFLFRFLRGMPILLLTSFTSA